MIEDAFAARAAFVVGQVVNRPFPVAQREGHVLQDARHGTLPTYGTQSICRHLATHVRRDRLAEISK